MKKITFLAGLPGSGKSTYCKTLKDVIVIESDEIRKEITGSYKIMPPSMKVVYDRIINLCNDYLKNLDSCHIVVDSTFLDDKRRSYFLDNIKGYEAIELIMFKYHDFNKIIERNKSRYAEKIVPLDVLIEMSHRYFDPSEENLSRYQKIQEIYID